MKIRRKNKNYLCLFLAGIMSLSIAANGDAVKSTSELEIESGKLKNELSTLNEEVVAMQIAIQDAENQLLLLEDDIARTETSLEVAKKEEAQQYTDMKNRIQFMYESGELTFLEILCEAEDMQDFLNRADFMSTINEYDRNMLNKYTETKIRVEEDKAALEKTKTDLQTLKEETAKRESELEEKVKVTQIDLNQVRADLAEARANETANSGTNPEVNEGGNSSGGGGQYTPSAGELDIFAGILDCEAISNYTARLAVATVIMNRVNSSKFSNTITGVIYAKGQYPPATSGKLDSVLARGPSALSYQVARDAMNGARVDSVSNCYYFLYAPSTNRVGVEIGNNLFFPVW